VKAESVVTNALVSSLRDHPELAIFLTLAIGFMIGRIRIGSFKFGNVLGTLIAGVLIGQLAIKVDPTVKAVFFSLFLFATGYKVGPQFFRGLKKNALAQVALTVVLCVTSLVTTLVAAKLLDYDTGTAAGLMAGAFTESTVIGTASDTIDRLDLPEAEKTRLKNNIPVAYAVSYLVGTGFVVWFLSVMGPRVLRIDLKEESRKLAGQMAAGGRAPDEDVHLAYKEWSIRAYRLADIVASRTVADIERSASPERVCVERIRRGTELIDATPETVLQSADIAAIGARRRVLLGGSLPLGVEVEDPGLLEFPMATLDLVVTKKDVAEQPLSALAQRHGRGVVLAKLIRGGEEIPFGAETIINRGDLLRVAGAQRDVERVGRAVGYIERPSSESDIVFLGLGIVVGGLVGLLTLTIGGLPLTLTTSGGALIMGLVFGWLRSVHPTFGRIPEPALWIFDTVGLAVFIGIVGLNAGPTFVAGLRETGPSLVVVGLIVAIVPHLVSLLFGYHVLKMNPVILLGACAGAGTITAALRAIQDESGSKLPVLGYTVPYAIGNILLTAWGPVIVVLTQ
jgi:putative transport protein